VNNALDPYYFGVRFLAVAGCWNKADLFWWNSELRWKSDCPDPTQVAHRLLDSGCRLHDPSKTAQAVIEMLQKILTQMPMVWPDHGPHLIWVSYITLMCGEGSLDFQSFCGGAKRLDRLCEEGIVWIRSGPSKYPCSAGSSRRRRKQVTRRSTRCIAQWGSYP
jgi:hypothetical protein